MKTVLKSIKKGNDEKGTSDKRNDEKKEPMKKGRDDFPFGKNHLRSFSCGGAIPL